MEMRTIKRFINEEHGADLIEYALLVVCIAVVCAVAVSMLGHKTQETFAIAAAIMPGAHADDNAPIAEANVIPHKVDGNGNIVLDSGKLVNTDRYAELLGAGGGTTLVTEP